MAQTSSADTRGNAKTSAKTTTGTAPAAAPQPSQAGGTGPIVITRAPRRKKRRYSRGLREIQQLERGIARSSQRLSRALERGLVEYRKRSNRSARRRRDGAIRDFVRNGSRGLSRGLRVASNAPYDMLQPVSTRRISRTVRNALRTAAPLFFR